VSLIVPAYAKLNLTLDVLGRRPDRYHEIESVMQSVSLHDLVSVEASDCASIETKGPPISGENLVLKAARELEAHFGRQLPFRIRLWKRIPMGAGLGGGSSDAAAFLLAAISVYRLSIGSHELVELAARVGQDVPFFLRGGTGHASGRGSNVEPLPGLAPEWTFLLVLPAVEVLTGQVYEASDGTAPSTMRSRRLVAELKAGRLEPALFGNDLEDITARLYPPVELARQRLRAKLKDAHMTGSGSAFYVAFSKISDAGQAQDMIRELGYKSWLCRPVPAWQA
jgi:4-diphosphocytidyl-2-C-methyl-D-erythritol kinase